MNRYSNNTLFGKYVIELRLTIFLVKCFYRFILTHVSKNFNLHLHVSLPVNTLIIVLNLKLFHFQTPKQSTSPQFSYPQCYIMMFIHLPLTHFPFHSFKPDIFQPFRRKNVQYFHKIPSQAHVCSVRGAARVLILSPQCTCPELIPHLKPHCSYR